MRLLYVEDNAFDADLVRRALARDASTAGAWLDIAVTLAQAREKLAAEPPYDALLADLNLPDGHGLTLIQEVRARQLPLAVVVLTSQGDEAAVLAALKAGADDYLPKTDELAQRVPRTLCAALERFRADAARHARTLRVLYAEPDAIDFDLTRRHFERHASNLQLRGVHDAASALACLADGAVDVLLLDYLLTGDSGLEVLKTVRLDRGLDLPVVMVTGQGSEDVAAQAMRLGATDYVVKRANYLHALPAVLENAFHRVSAAREHAALRLSEERLALVLRGSSDASWDFQLAGGGRHLSPRLWQMLGYDATPAADGRPSAGEPWPPDVAGVLMQYLGATLEGSGDGIEIELGLRHHRGHFVPLLVRGFILRDAAGRATRASGTCTDLSERKRAEAEIRQLNSTLEARVRERTAELQLAMQRAESASRAKSEFLSHMSHELRTPMNAILGFAQIIEMSAPTTKQLKWAGEIRRAGSHLLLMIEDLLDLARIEVGKITIKLEALDLEAILAEAVPIVQPLIDARNLQLTRVGQGECPPVWADQLRLRQVLVNLLSNAAKYNREGGRITVHSERRGDLVRLSVADTGQGLSKTQLARLFQPFERLGAERGQIEGTGIGLALSAQLARLMGVAIGVESREGEGSVFWIDLPCAEGRAAAAQSQLQPLPPAAQAPDLLYIEDNPSNVEIVSFFLTQRPLARLRAAADGATGLALARERRPDCILLDIHLPGMDGYEVLRQLRTDAMLRDVPVVALSADAMPHDVQRGLAAGFDRYLTKPIDLDQLQRSLDELLHQRHALPPAH